MADSDPWNDPLPPDLSQIRVQFNPDDESRTISAEWAHEILRRMFKARPAMWNNKFAELYAEWVAGEFKASPP